MERETGAATYAVNEASRRVRMGVIGCGGVAWMAHLSNIESNPLTELVSVCDVNAQRLSATVAKWRVKSSYRDYQEMLAKEHLDAVVIATPNFLHREQGIAAAEAGLHVLIEKPLACTNKEAWDIVGACEKSNKKLMVGCDRRFWLQSEMAKKLIDDGFIGKVVMSRATMHELNTPYQENIAFTDYRLRPEESGSGTLFDQGSHKVDLIRWLVGRDVQRVIGSARTMLMPPGRPDDVAWLTMEFEDGTTGSVSTNRFSPAVSEVTELYGTDGTIYLCSDAINPYQSAPLAVYTGREHDWDDLPDLIKKYRYPQSFFFEDLISHPIPKRWITITPPREWSYYRMLTHFAECVLFDGTPMVTGSDGAQVVEIMCGVFKSMETNSWVDLPLGEEVIPPLYASGRPTAAQTG